MLLTQRAEPENAAIYVKAKIGFVRKLDDEFEAVARIAISSMKAVVSGKKLWVYMNGERKYIPWASCEKILRADGDNGYALDMEYNENGVRRYAAPVFRQGKFAGVVALAENFKPDADIQIQKTSKMLIGEIKNIMEAK